VRNCLISFVKLIYAFSRAALFSSSNPNIKTFYHVDIRADHLSCAIVIKWLQHEVRQAIRSRISISIALDLFKSATEDYVAF